MRSDRWTTIRLPGRPVTLRMNGYLTSSHTHARTRIFVVIVVTAEIRSHPVPSRSAAAYTARASHHRTYTRSRREGSSRAYKPTAAAAAAAVRVLRRVPPTWTVVVVQECVSSGACRRVGCLSLSPSLSERSRSRIIISNR